MNIFKVLANGDGSINEANVSAFLGYLLNPYEDHGLGFVFLERILNCLFEKNELDFNTKRYEYEILFEQAFKDEDKKFKKKEIVDIVILCFENNKGNYKELMAESAIAKTRELKYIFLIENKVTTTSKKGQQLKSQFENTIKRLNIDKQKVVSIYITPDDSIYHKEFDSFNENQLKAHFIWKNKTKDQGKIQGVFNLFEILSELIEEESKGKIESMNAYTRNTLVSFVKFIETGFKSQIVEQIENKAGKYILIVNNNIEEYMFLNKELLNNDFNEFLEDFTNYIKTKYPHLYTRHSKTHPISVFRSVKGEKILGFNRNGKKLEFHFVFRNNPHNNLREKYRRYLLSQNFHNYKETNEGLFIRDSITIEKLKELFDNVLQIVNI